MIAFVHDALGEVVKRDLPGTDLLHMRARVYAAGLARFLQPDPIGFASGQLNLYAYVGGDPINGVDPSGLRRRCFRIVDQNGKVLVDKICLDLEDVVKVTGRRPGPVPGKSSESLTANDVNDLLNPAFLSGMEVPPPLSLDLSGLTGESPPSNEIPVEECAKLTSAGCAYRFDENGKLQLTPEYQQIACQNYKALQRSYQQIGAVGVAPSMVGGANALTGGAVSALSRLSAALGGGPLAFLAGFTSAIATVLSLGGAPAGCS